MTKALWQLTPVDESSVKRLEYGLGISRITARVLVARGFSKEAEAKRFLDPQLSDLPGPENLPDIDRALSRLIDAVCNDEHIMVLGHDDVDGITAATIVFGSLKEIGADVSYYIPDSPSEGIGLSRKILDRFKSSGVSLVITVDCGVSNREEVAYASSLGIDVIITDHHEPPDELPPAVAVTDAKRHDSLYGFRDLAGCGVAYRFMEAFAERYRKVGKPPSLDGILGMAALGSFADRVPLLDENRIIVHRGVRDLLSKRLVPFVALRSHIWVDQDSTMTEVLSKIVPIIGACRSHEGGNLGCELLLSTENDDAEEVLMSLIMEAEHRRERARKALDRVMDRLAGLDIDSSRGLVLVEERLPNKTVGFCAARLADRYHKPVVIVSMKGDTGVGEARGPKGVDLVAALKAHQEFFLDFGGHKQAAGFSIERPKVPAFRESFMQYLNSEIDPSVIRKRIVIDGKINPQELTVDNLRSLVCLEPFGQENHRPVFLLESLHGSMLKETEGTWKLGEVGLTGLQLSSEDGWEVGDTMNMVVSPFGDGSSRSVEVIDWKRAI